ncbi:spore coat associated protein CotJA [Blautia sp. CLA-JM-H16]|jgi:hypothetical protein|uniref:Spore coat associated protein CotJA n=1 Tax=Blautia aquisgranensis TaxID=3133153 RepID=A0ABV1BFB5_9FIRM
MDRFQMNRSGGRPYNYTCGMNGVARSCQKSDSKASTNKEMYSHLKHLIPAMAYVPYQEFEPTFELRKALQLGTIFPTLCKPFCGRRGGCR